MAILVRAGGWRTCATRARTARCRAALCALALLVVASQAAADGTAALPGLQAPASPPPVDPSAVAATRTRLAGSWRQSSGPANAASRNAGVQQSVNALFVMFRSIAYGRLIDANPLFPVVRIAFADGQIEVRTGAVVARSPEGGGERTVIGLDHATNRLTQTVNQAELVQTTWNDDGARTTRFVPGADGRTLTLHIQIRSPRLPVPVTYAMSLTREGD
jgi:hypothetical protein